MTCLAKFARALTKTKYRVIVSELYAPWGAQGASYRVDNKRISMQGSTEQIIESGSRTRTYTKSCTWRQEM